MFNSFDVLILPSTLRSRYCCLLSNDWVTEVQRSYLNASWHIAYGLEPMFHPGHLILSIFPWCFQSCILRLGVEHETPLFPLIRIPCLMEQSIVSRHGLYACLYMELPTGCKQRRQKCFLSC